MNWEYLVSTGRINLQKLAHIAGFSHSASIDDRISAVLATPSVLLPPETSKTMSPSANILANRLLRE